MISLLISQFRQDVEEISYSHVFIQHRSCMDVDCILDSILGILWWTKQEWMFTPRKVTILGLEVPTGNYKVKESLAWSPEEGQSPEGDKGMSLSPEWYAQWELRDRATSQVKIVCQELETYKNNPSTFGSNWQWQEAWLETIKNQIMSGSLVVSRW